MKLLDLAKFEKVKEDKNTTTMRHKDGHEMVIMHAKLPKIHREQLKRLALAQGGKVQNFDDGGAATAQSSPDQSAPDASSSDTSSAAPAQSSSNPITINVGTPQQAPPVQTQDIPGTSAVPASPAAQLAAQPVSPTIPQVPNTPPNVNPSTGTMNPSAVSVNSQTAGNLQGQINAAKAAGMVPIEQGYVDAAAQAAQTDQQNLADLKGHIGDFNSYIQNHPINPNAYVENMSSGKKATTAIGLMLGGLGGRGNGNVGMDYLNKQIVRDIDGQKARMGQQASIYSAYHQLYGDSVATNAATKASMLDIYNHKVNQLAAQLGTPQAAQAAMQFNANSAIEKSKALKDAVVDLRRLPGASPVGGSGPAAPGSRGASSPGNGNPVGQLETPYNPPGTPQPTGIPNTPAVNTQATPPDQRSWQEKAANILWGGGATPPSQAANAAVADVPKPTPMGTPASVLAPGAAEHYANINTEEPTLDAKQKGDAIDQYQRAVQVDKSLAQIERLMPQVKDTANWGGWISDHAGEAGVTGAALGAAAGAILGHPIIGAEIGGSAGAGAAKLGSIVGGDQELQHEPLKAAFRTAIESALVGVSTPTEITKLVDAYTPTVRDTPQTYALKLKELREKIINLTPTGALPSYYLNKNVAGHRQAD